MTPCIASKYRGRLSEITICLIGLLLLTWRFSSPCLAGGEEGQVVARDGIFVLYSNGVVVDDQRKLMWARSDNGTRISIDGAKAYVKALDLAGYSDWRIPDIRELESLMVKDSSNDTPGTDGCDGDYEIHPFFKLTCCCPWALQDSGTRPAAYPFIRTIASGSMWHHKSNRIGNRILAVRNMKE